MFTTKSLPVFLAVATIGVLGVGSGWQDKAAFVMPGSSTPVGGMHTTETISPGKSLRKVLMTRK